MNSSFCKLVDTPLMIHVDRGRRKNFRRKDYSEADLM